MFKGRENFIRIMDVSLTRSCNYNCSWCNQRQDLTNPTYDMKDSKRLIVGNKMRPGQEWIDGLNEFPYRDQYEKIIFSGGEPSLHPDFFEIVSRVKGYRNKMVVTNLSFDVALLVENCRKNDSSVIVQPSFHFEFADFDEFIKKLKLLNQNGLLSNFIPVSIVDLPDKAEPKMFKEKFRQHGFEASLYMFEGYYKGAFDHADVNIFGARGPGAEVDCLSSVTCVKPNGDIVFCQTDTYQNDPQNYGNICDKQYAEIPLNRECAHRGMCHVSSASWVKMRDLTTGRDIWQGKNFRKKSVFNSIRSYCEQKNLKGLSKIKALYKSAKRILGQ